MCKLFSNGSKNCIYEEIKIQNEIKLNEVIEEFNRYCSNKSKTYIFRGQRDSNWSLESSFDRTIKSYSEMYQQKHNKSDNYSLELKIINKFIRHGQNLIDQKINFENYLDVISLMQHYGAPSRLIDWSYSFYIALFFAFDDAEKDHPAVFAFDSYDLNNTVKKLYKDSEKTIELLDSLKNYEENKKHQNAFKELLKINFQQPYIYGVNPFYLNERLSIQQGLFLFQGDISKNFEENYNGFIKQTSNAKKIKKYKINIKLKPYILRMLNRMNINSRSLFPGIEGYARSFKDLLIINDTN